MSSKFAKKPLSVETEEKAPKITVVKKTLKDDSEKKPKKDAKPVKASKKEIDFDKPMKAKAPRAKGESKERTPDTRKIKLLVKDNPKREGSASYTRFELYKDKSVKTVADFIAAGGTSGDIRHDQAKGHIELA